MIYDTALARSAYELAYVRSHIFHISDLSTLAATDGPSPLPSRSLSSNSKPPMSKNLTPTKRVRLASRPHSDLANACLPRIVVFLEKLHSYPALPTAHIVHLGTLYRLADTPNAEIRLRFYELALLDPATDTARQYAPEALKWAVGDDGTGIIKGRMKFCRPIFRAASKVDHALAKKTFLQFKTSFHPIAQKLIEKVRCSIRNIYVITDHFRARISALSNQRRSSNRHLIVYLVIRGSDTKISECFRCTPAQLRPLKLCIALDV